MGFLAAKRRGEPVVPKRELDWSSFQGIPDPHFTQIPDVMLDVYMSALSHAELRVLLYIARHTYGFKKKSDHISLRQMVDGIQKRDGTWQDHGTGLSRRSVREAVKSLEEKGLIQVDRVKTADGDSAVNVYTMRRSKGG